MFPHNFSCFFKSIQDNLFSFSIHTKGREEVIGLVLNDTQIHTIKAYVYLLSSSLKFRVVNLYKSGTAFQP